MTVEKYLNGRSLGSQKKIFIVEDEWILAMALQDMLTQLGHQVVAVASKLQDGLVMAEQGDFDFAILDVSLHGEMSHPIADVLEARGLPYAFATGYSRAAKGARNHPLMLEKPYGIEDLRQIIPAS